jgi:hypothetical protein
MNTSIEELNIEYKDLVAKIVQAEDELRVLQKERHEGNKRLHFQPDMIHINHSKN